MEVVRERKKNDLRDIFRMKLIGGEQMRSMLLFLHTSMTGATCVLLNGGLFMELLHQCFNL